MLGVSRKEPQNNKTPEHIPRIRLKQLHHHTPRQRRKRRPGILSDLRRKRLPRHNAQALARRNCNAGQREDDTRKDVDDDLLADGRDLATARGALAEDDVAAEEAAEEGIVGA
ncbi:hypothetical protein E4U13_001766 [Claviceps humidiphila]|uniref:Uncharacterized protein n=1 Tax=Claviceps humidiphila TaxID=1294629 RepID=A0A9P7Q0R6_9HYPO|nr:hypothetical protein E4U13_001766 [Claviceps humidiphila]